MKPGLLILPFLAILVAALGTAAGSVLPEFKWIGQLSWGLGLVIIVLWVALDTEGFRSVFRRKGAKYGASSGLVVLLGLVCIIGVAVLSSRPRFNKSIDLTRDKLNTLSDQSLKVIKTIKDSGEPVKIEAFVGDEKTTTELRDVLNLYIGKGANLQVDYIDPQTHPTQAMAAKVTEGNTFIFTHGKQEKRITSFTEEKITNALVSVMKDKTKKIYFTKGHGEGELKAADPGGFNTVAGDLEGNRDAVEEISLLETAKVPDDANMLVIAGPKYEFKEGETRIIDEYLKRGGSVFVMVGAMVPVENLNHLLAKYGVKFDPDLLILAPNDIRAQMIGQNNAIVSEFDEFNPVTKDFARQSQVQLVMRNTRSVDEVKDNINKMKVDLAGKTAKEVIRVRNVTSAKDLEGLTEDRWEAGSFPVIAVASGKTQAPATAEAAGATKDQKSDALKDGAAPRAKETRIVAVGSVDFATNQGAQAAAEHRDMFMNIVNYLLQDEDFIAIRPKDATKSTLSLTSTSSQLNLLFIAFIFPFVFLGGGTFTWLKRRRA